MTKEETLLSKHFIDLSRQAQQKGIVLFSDFLNLNELNLFQQGVSRLHSGFQISGGYELSERQMVAFLPDALCYSWEFPISCLLVEPLNKKFAEELTHRDVLGSLMSLGVGRSVLGDILVDGTQIHVFCQEKIAPYLMENLTLIRHTSVQASQVSPENLHLEPNCVHEEGIVTSNRLDSVIACLCNLSRSQASLWVRNGKVFVNHREMLQTTYECKEGEMISVRSVGRFRFRGFLGETRKGRMKIQYERYV